MRPHGLLPRLQPFASTIFAEMTELAARTGAVNLGQGFPDTEGPASIWGRPGGPGGTWSASRSASAKT